MKGTPTPGLSSSLFFAVLALLLMEGCTPTSDADPQGIVDRAMAAHGSENLDQAEVEFDFRDRHFVVTRDGGRFTYERTFTDSTGADVRDVLTNDSLYREVDGERVELTEEERLSAETGVNSVVYFALLPYFLNDPAVEKRYLGEATIEGEPYDKVEVTFQEEGGGQDYQDRYVYWFHQDEHTMDYLAYSFEVNGGGTRFRQAVNPRVVGGVRFADYLNGGADTLGTPIHRYDEMLAAGEIDPISEIELKNIDVRPLTP